jgi:membrane protease YdiL (CAAX protease family)
MLLLVTLGITMVGFQFIGAFFGLSLSYLFYPGDMEMYIQAILDPTADEAMRMPLLIMQGVGSFTGFIILPWLMLKFFYRGHIADLGNKVASPILIIITLFITLFFMGFNAPFIEWNQNISLPEALTGLEEKLKVLEETLDKTSDFITHFESGWQLLLGVVVIAIIPGIGEEFVFRGLVQNHVYRISNNIHIAIWMGALLFSLFHLQFYGLVPRMLLGALFGYLYYFSGNIIYPMVAHFFNNGFTLVMLYLYQQNVVEYNIEDTEVLPWPQVIFSAGITITLFILFKQNANKEIVDE